MREKEVKHISSGAEKATGWSKKRVNSAAFPECWTGERKRRRRGKGGVD